VFFRAKSVSEVWFILTNMCGTRASLPQVNLGLHGIDIAVAIGALAVMEVVHALQRHTPARQFLRGQVAWVRWSVYAVAVLMILVFGEFTSQDFIYFQF
jgi:hypothetical protein